MATCIEPVRAVQCSLVPGNSVSLAVTNGVDVVTGRWRARRLREVG